LRRSRPSPTCPRPTYADTPGHHNPDIRETTLAKYLKFWPQPAATGRLLITRAFDPAHARLVFDAPRTPELAQAPARSPPGWTMPVCEIDYAPRRQTHRPMIWHAKRPYTQMGIGSASFARLCRPSASWPRESFDGPRRPLPGAQALDNRCFVANGSGTDRLHAHSAFTQSRRPATASQVPGWRQGMAAQTDWRSVATGRERAEPGEFCCGQIAG